jgi:polyphosphate kinase
VQIELVVRGICSLRPGVEGVSENIRVRSIIGRFLEHSRVYWFANDGEPRLYLSSADLMERNLDRRVEVAFPIESRKMQQRIHHALELCLADNAGTYWLQADGQYQRCVPAAGEPVHDVQAELMALLCSARGNH